MCLLSTGGEHSQNKAVGIPECGAENCVLQTLSSGVLVDTSKGGHLVDALEGDAAAR